MTDRARLALAALGLLPLLMAPKCFPYQGEPPAPPDAATPDAAASDDDGGGSSPEASVNVVTFTPAVACPEANEARLRVVDYSYQIQCGCLEASGKTCTVPAGTDVVWQFGGDPEEHNVASDGGGFGASGERLTGIFSHQFETPGRFGYGCTIHRQMSGYAIVVE